MLKVKTDFLLKCCFVFLITPGYGPIFCHRFCIKLFITQRIEVLPVERNVCVNLYLYL